MSPLANAQPGGGFRGTLGPGYNRGAYMTKKKPHVVKKSPEPYIKLTRTPMN